MTKTLLFVGLVALCFSAVVATQVEDFILMVNESPFGQTMMGTLELEIQSGAPGDYLMNLLKKMKATVEGDAKAANVTHEKFVANCKQEIAAIKGEIRVSARNVIESKKLISKSQQKLSWDQAQVESQERQKKEAHGGLTKINNIREKEAKEYADKTSEINKALAVLQQGKAMVEKNLKKPAFVQVSSDLNNYVTSMVMVLDKPEYHGRGYVSLVSYIAELLQAPQANQQTVDKIVNILQKIIDELEKAKNVEYKADQERIKNHEELVKMYTDTIANLNESITKLNNQINSLKGIIATNTQRITDSTRSIQIKSRQKLKLKKECRTELNAFKKENTKRMADLDLVAQALALMEEHIDEFRKIVLDTAKTHIAGRYEEGATGQKPEEQKVETGKKRRHRK